MQFVRVEFTPGITRRYVSLIIYQYEPMFCLLTIISSCHFLYRTVSESAYANKEGLKHETGQDYPFEDDLSDKTEPHEEHKEVKEETWTREEDQILLQRIKDRIYSVDAELSNQFTNRNEIHIQQRVDFLINYLTLNNMNTEESTT